MGTLALMWEAIWLLRWVFVALAGSLALGLVVGPYCGFNNLEDDEPRDQR